MADGVKTYVVTERAGRRVAGRPVIKGAKIALADVQAEHYLATGEIVPEGAQLDTAFATSKVADTLRAEAEAFRTRATAPVVVDAPTEQAPASVAVASTDDAAKSSDKPTSKRS